jgi:hypothetical protein
VNAEAAFIRPEMAGRRRRPRLKGILPMGSRLGFAFNASTPTHATMIGYRLRQ